MKYIVSVSGGKDSTAALLWALDTLPNEDVVAYYSDTKWEHHSVYEYLDYLEEKLNIKIERIESEGMIELSKRKKKMPNPVMRFCTYELKIKPFFNWVYDNYISKGVDFINITGVRREESSSRADTEAFGLQSETIRFYDDRVPVQVSIKVMHPLAYWDTQRVFDYIKSHGVDVNPLYKKGMSRVGCYPCIFARKHDLQNMEPEYVERMRKLESDVSVIAGKKIRFLKPSSDRYLRPTLDMGYTEDYCVNQYGICE